MIYITHDIDWLYPLHPYSVIKSVIPTSKWISISQLWDKKLFLKQIEELRQLNLSLNVKPTYFLGATNHQFGRYDLRYSAYSEAYHKVLDLLKHENIGLHSDLHTAIKQQQQLLEKHTKKSILFHRSHFLKHNIIRLEKELTESSIQFDFSRGSARNPEYLAHQTLTGIQYVPTILFDNAFFFNKPTPIFENLNYIFERIAFQQTQAAILFHPENMLIKSDLSNHYQATIELIHKHGLPIFNGNPL